MKEKGKKPCLDKQGTEQKKKRNDIYIYIYILYGVLTRALASCKFALLFFSPWMVRIGV